MKTKYELLKRLLIEKEELEKRKGELMRETSITAPTEEEDDDDYFTGDVYSVVNHIKYIEEQVESLKGKIKLLEKAKAKKKDDLVESGDVVLLKNHTEQMLFCLTDDPHKVDLTANIISIFSEIGKLVAKARYGDIVIIRNKEFQILPA